MREAQRTERFPLFPIPAETWGCEVRPNAAAEASQPWHWVVIPMVGIATGEIFYLRDLAAGCAGSEFLDAAAFMTGQTLLVDGGSAMA